ncbi:hypothetical protein [Staphylococcus hyicus]|uniref:hypothetical protein n=1 Tax=Staphylococcus hyicus TaxID=1284 RepID=UPI001304B487|nr:hypothetical protein [Staphylococcus hyicus]NJH82536.1 hypothetical protein [Staphylococcus hyicus]
MTIQDPFTYTVKFDAEQMELMEKLADKIKDLKSENEWLKHQVKKQDERLTKLESK